MQTFRYLLHFKVGVAMSFVAAAVGAYLLTTHTGHVVAAVPYLFLLACPLMHLFGHHHHHSGHQPESDQPAAPRQ